LALWWLHNLRWSPRNRDLRSEDAAEELLKLGVVEYKVRTPQYKGRTLESKGSTHEVDPIQKPHSAAPTKDTRIQSQHRRLQSKSPAMSPNTKLALWAGKYAGSNFFVGGEDRGLVVGPPGTGKTAFLLNQILRAKQQGLSFAAVDLKPELFNILAPTLLEAGYRVLRVNPAQITEDADCWNPLTDIDDETSLAELCAALLPIREAGEAPFVESQRDWLKAAVFHVKTQPGGSVISAFNLLSSVSDHMQLLTLLEKSPSVAAARLARRLVASLSSNKPDPLIMSGYSGCLRSLDYLGLPSVQAALSYSTFSVRDIGKGNQPTALFLQFEEAKMGALGPLLAFTGSALLSLLIDTAGQRAPVALFLDELGNMPPIPSLPQKLNTIRSRQIPTWMYFQTTEQMTERYGRGADSLFFASSDVQIFFRLNDQHTRELVSKLIGTYERAKISVSANGATAATRTSSYERVNIIEAHELGQLRSGEVITLYRGAAARGRATPHFIDFPQFRRN
jgi:type IV secretion system protein VirD4